MNIYKSIKNFRFASEHPAIIQSRAGESGAVCLAMVLAHYKSYPKLSEVKQACGFEGGELPLDHLLIIAKRIGFDVEQPKTSPEGLSKQTLPVIIKTKAEKYLMVVAASDNEFTLHDPEVGERKITKYQMSEIWAGEAVILTPNKDFTPIERGQNLLEEISQWMAPTRMGLGYVIIAGLILLIPAFVIPALAKVFFDNIIMQHQIRMFNPMLSIMWISIILGCFLIYVQQKVLLRTELKMSIDESAKFVSHLLKVSYNFLWSNPTGDTVKRIKLNDAVSTLLSRDFTKFLLSIVSIIFYGTIMLNYSIVLTVAGVSIILFNLVALSYFSAKRTALSQSLFQKEQETFSVANDLIENIETVKSLGWENESFSLWSKHLTAAINENQKLGFSSRILTVLPDFLTQLNKVVIVFLGGVLIIHGEITVGVFVALQAFIASFSQPVQDTVEISKKFQENVSNLNNLREVNGLEVDPLCDDTNRLSVGEITPFNARLTGALNVNNLSFSYSKFGVPFIENFSLEASPGKRIALVGRSGSGKSTLFKVLAGLYQQDSGEILYDDMPLSTLNTDVFRNSVAMIDQDIFLFTGTVADNIVMWNRSIDHEDIVAAAKDADLHEVISAKQGGYQAHVAPGGGNFSGGQRQRIEIARGLVTNPAIVFLDEATSALDSQTEQTVMENIRRHNCTTISIAHRLSTIRDFDEIIVMEKGCAIQRGTHAELMKQKGQLYCDLVSEA